jgi:hypothetical protein
MAALVLPNGIIERKLSRQLTKCMSWKIMTEY